MPLRAKFRKTPSAPSAPSADRHGRPRNWTPCRRRRRRRKRIMRFPSFHNGRRPPANVDSGGGCQSRVKDLASPSRSVRVSGSTKETRRKRTKRRTNWRNKAKKKRKPCHHLGDPVRPLPSFSRHRRHLDVYVRQLSPSRSPPFADCEYCGHSSAGEVPNMRGKVQRSACGGVSRSGSVHYGVACMQQYCRNFRDKRRPLGPRPECRRRVAEKAFVLLSVPPFFIGFLARLIYN